MTYDEARPVLEKRLKALTFHIDFAEDAAVRHARSAERVADRIDEERSRDIWVQRWQGHVAEREAIHLALETFDGLEKLIEKFDKVMGTMNVDYEDMFPEDDDA